MIRWGCYAVWTFVVYLACALLYLVYCFMEVMGG